MSTRRSFEATMCNLLRKIQAGDFAPLAENEAELLCLKECVNRGYVAGIKTVTLASGKIMVKLAMSPSVTHSGLVFLEAHTNRPLKYLLRNWIAITALIIALVGLMHDCGLIELPQQTQQQSQDGYTQGNLRD